MVDFNDLEKMVEEIIRDEAIKQGVWPDTSTITEKDISVSSIGGLDQGLLSAPQSKGLAQQVSEDVKVTPEEEAFNSVVSHLLQGILPETQTSPVPVAQKLAPQPGISTSVPVTPTPLGKLPPSGPPRPLGELPPEGQIVPLEQTPTTTTPAQTTALEAPKSSFSMSGIPEQRDYRQEIQKILSGMPSSVEELVGKPQEDARATYGKLPWYTQLATQVSYGVAKKDWDADIDKVQHRLDERYKTELDFAKAKMSTKMNLELKQIELLQEQDKEKREGTLKILVALGEANPEVAKNSADYWRAMAKTMGVSDDFMKSFLQSRYNPTTGKYENLYIPQYQRDWEQKKYVMEQMEKIDPGLPKDAYMQMAYHGTYPDYVNNLKKLIEKKLIDPKLTPTDRRNLMSQLQEIENLKDRVSPDEFVNLNKMQKAGIITPEQYKRAHDILVMKSTIGVDLTKTMIASEASKERAAPSAAAYGQLNMAQALKNPTSLVLLEMDPSLRLMATQKEVSDRFSTQFTMYDSLLQTIAAGSTISKDQEKALNMYRVYQRKLLNKIGLDALTKMKDLHVLEAQKAIELALEGLQPKQIVEAIIKSRVSEGSGVPAKKEKGAISQLWDDWILDKSGAGKIFGKESE